MLRAVTMARRSFGLTGRNPAVGCVLVDPATNQEIIATATGKGGRPHAEELALAKAGKKAISSVAYLTLEPCAHIASQASSQGIKQANTQTSGQEAPDNNSNSAKSSCASKLANAKVSQVIFACLDQDKRTKGLGLKTLENKKVKVEKANLSPSLEKEVAYLVSGFFTRITKQRPKITLKLATDPAGNIGSGDTAQSKITNDCARVHAMARRSRFDAIMVGNKTIDIDNPKLNCRLTGLEYSSPIKVLFDAKDSNLFDHKYFNKNIFASGGDIILITDKHFPSDFPRSFARSSKYSFKEVIAAPRLDNGFIDMNIALQKLANCGINNLLVEGGATLINNMIKCGLFDEIHHYQGSKKIGGEKLIKAPENFFDAIKKSEKYLTRRFGDNILSIYLKID